MSDIAEDCRDARNVAFQSSTFYGKILL